MAKIIVPTKEFFFDGSKLTISVEKEAADAMIKNINELRFFDGLPEFENPDVCPECKGWGLRAYDGYVCSTCHGSGSTKQ